MRVILAMALLGLLSAPAALADAATMPPAVVVAMRTGGGDSVLLSWSPSPGAVAYVILAGSEPDALVRVGETAATVFSTEAPDTARYFGIVALGLQGDESEPHTLPVEQKKSCVSTSTEMSFSVNLGSCVALVLPP